MVKVKRFANPNVSGQSMLQLLYSGTSIRQRPTSARNPFIDASLLRPLLKHELGVMLLFLLDIDIWSYCGLSLPTLGQRQCQDIYTRFDDNLGTPVSPQFEVGDGWLSAMKTDTWTASDNASVITYIGRKH
jgi:hypothetical protein